MQPRIFYLYDVFLKTLSFVNKMMIPAEWEQNTQVWRFLPNLRKQG